MKDNHSSSLVVMEVLAESAHVFFGNRCRLDEMVRSFHDHVDMLRKKFEIVLNHAALLNFLLVDEEMIGLFYKELRISDVVLTSSTEFTQDIVPKSRISGWRFSSRYRRTFYWVYNGLKTIVDDYQFGGRSSLKGNSDVPVYYGMVEKMCEIINSEIGSINYYHTSSSILNFVNQFSDYAETREAIGASPSMEDIGHIDRKMSMERIDFEQLNLMKLPQLPIPESIRFTIDRICHDILNRYPDIARKRIKLIEG